MSRILVLPILFTVAAAFTIKQEGQKEKDTFSNQQISQPVIDAIPTKANVIA